MVEIIAMQKTPLNALNTKDTSCLKKWELYKSVKELCNDYALMTAYLYRK